MGYCSISDLQVRYGVNNLTKWSAIDGNNSDPLNATRQQNAIDWATAQINSLMMRGAYAIPFQFQDSYAQAMVNEWCIELAVWKLYQARGHLDEDKSSGKFEDARAKVISEIMRVRSGTIVLNAARKWGDNANIPTVIM